MSTPDDKAQDPDATRIASLTPREHEVIVCIGEGFSDKEIAEHLFISKTTVRFHMEHIFAKLEVRGRAKLLVYAHRHGLITPPS